MSGGRIAVVGSGIAGLGAAWLLSRRYEVTLFEAADYLGGHTHTHDIQLEGQRYAVDSGFIVFNPQHYPLLTRLFAEIDVASQSTTMSFSVHDARSGLEYNAGSLGGLFCQRRNLLSPRFWGMLANLRRFYRQAPAVLTSDERFSTLGEYLHRHGYSDTFRDQHLVPMASALWSSPSQRILEFPMGQLIGFMANHHMLQISGRPQWQVVRGGSSSYVRALRRRWQVQERLSTPVHAVRRAGNGVVVTSLRGDEHFDEVVLACHADDALALLSDATPAEQQILGAITYQNNDTVLHTDASVLPRDRRAWAAWNAHVPADPQAPCTVSYWMNALQSINAPQPFIVSLNRDQDIAPEEVLRRMRYRHPVQNAAALDAQARKAQIQGQRHTWFAGAAWGFGFHEDGLRSGVDVAHALGVPW
ncbi:FAD-dependent oxidoreductase [Xanthomonas campestris pv. campestris]|uniref:FAD-dependent oxidoreductase n=1 Tax=Xanthomonas campestris TaxID=339 RepID=UPI00094ABADA|nr:FAD-dependent oxidoreductase [Xanthomonas campestris]MEA0697383.1 FAD-dependent oxidoreductase [Xanthomonas campestris pv. campestris]MEA0776816.1 FAD-dependent oxidoreductase [Xanthomonas campestris pv. campestris]MEA0784538.1 FAD-dependent oxidoreductase [Xanthomonas campestris pv. campestris]MEA0859437.1 FAD-dependent oxidoreductase [Xanthomonas campestris pv. campestris]MEA0941566.1 FAD-dependent oxidoreductase [Xanthomonas campestris pv. campestris]